MSESTEERRSGDSGGGQARLVPFEANLADLIDKPKLTSFKLVSEDREVVETEIVQKTFSSLEQPSPYPFSLALVYGPTRAGKSTLVSCLLQLMSEGEEDTRSRVSDLREEIRSGKRSKKPSFGWMPFQSSHSDTMACTTGVDAWPPHPAALFLSGGQRVLFADLEGTGDRDAQEILEEQGPLCGLAKILMFVTTKPMAAKDK